MAAATGAKFRMIASSFRASNFIRARFIAVGALVLFFGASLVFAGFTVVIDPGHGGTLVPGKSDSSQEGDGASWNNAHSATKKLLEKDSGFRIKLR